MKKAVIYTRVSTDEQKDFGFSLPDQEARLLRYCRDKGYEVIKHYQDDHSAKDFNRPQFNRFREDIKNKVIKPDVFVVVRMDRFSRNAMETLRMIDEFTKRGIKYESIENHIDLTTPEALIPYMLNAVMPEVDNRRRALNTKRGLRQAQRGGRWTSKAPIGYVNDKANKIVVPDEKKAPLVIWAFETYSKGLLPATDVWRMLKSKGLPMCKQNFYDMLSNPFYIGKIIIRQWENEPEEIVNGIHQQIVSEETFRTCQYLLQGKRKPYQNKTKHEQLPLKGHLICPQCGKVMTGSGSKGGSGGIYHYYHCQRKYGCKNAIKASEANEAFERLIGMFKMKDEVLKLYYHILEDVFKKANKEKELEKAQLETEIMNVEKKITSLNDKFVDDLIDAPTYKALKKTLEDRKTELIMKHALFGKMNKDFTEHLRIGISLLSKIDDFYRIAKPEVKSKFISSIFPEKLVYENNRYRTNRINEVFRSICQIDSNLQKRKPISKDRLSTKAPQTGLEPVTL